MSEEIGREPIGKKKETKETEKGEWEREVLEAAMEALSLIHISEPTRRS